MDKTKKSDAEWQKTLSSEAYRVAREGGTERAFSGEYNHSKSEGVYLCACCGNELFRSDDKYDSGSGWPSFVRPANAENVHQREDPRHGGGHIEVLCQSCDAHLGHVFDDGPAPTGKRYCINSVCLRLETDKKDPESGK